jgi:hypothetical protein
MTLKLSVRDVAQTNIDKFDQLGAFHGETECKYHYSNGYDCAIGICDPEFVLNDNTKIIRWFLEMGFIEADNIDGIEFIQRLHDYRILVSRPLKPYWIEMPYSVWELIEKIQKPDDLTPELYKEIMRCIIESEE